MPACHPRAESVNDSRLAIGAAIAASLLGALIVGHAARHVTFSGDDWTFVTERRGFSAGVFLRPHGEHLSALPIAAYKLLLAIFGASSYTPFMALLLVLHAVNCVLLYAIARRYLGPWVALAPVAIFAVLGPAWQDLLWAFQIGYLGSVAAGLGMILCLERGDRGGDGGAAVCLLVSLLCSSIGLAMVGLGLFRILLERPPDYRRLWAIAAPVVVYLVWYAAYGVSTLRLHNVVKLPRYLAQALSAALASATGLAQTHTSPYVVSTTYGRYLALLAVLGLGYYLLRGGRPAPLAWAVMAAAVGLWVAQCLEFTVPARSAQQSRYQYTAVALVLLAGAALLRGRKLPGWSAAVLAVLTLAICASNISMLDQRGGFWRRNAAYVSAETGAMQIARASISPDFTPENGFTIPAIGNHNLIISAREYFSAIDAFGSPADPPSAIQRRPERVREAADLILASAERLTLTRASTATVTAGAGCRSRPGGAALGELTLGPGTLTVRVARGHPAVLQLRRFASRYALLSLGNTPPAFRLPTFAEGGALTLRLPRDATRIPWHARVLGAGSVVACVTG